MKRAEANKLISDIRKRVVRKGMPINTRNGSNDAIADYICDIVTDYIFIDTPLGVGQSYGYDACPVCNHVVGNSAYYCKNCGSYLREK